MILLIYCNQLLCLLLQLVMYQAKGKVMRASAPEEGGGKVFCVAESTKETGNYYRHFILGPCLRNCVELTTLE